jgi:lysyl endopeptidase
MRRSRWGWGFGLLLAVAIAAPLGAAYAREALDSIPIVRVPALDLNAIELEDAQFAEEGQAPRFAIPVDALLSPASDGVWEDFDNTTRLWRLRITSPGALSLNLGFTAFYLPEGAELRVYAADGSSGIGPYTFADNRDYRELWTPVVLADDIVVEVLIPRAVANQLMLELTAINVGYRGFGEATDRAGSCEIDVVCPVAAPWRAEIPAIAVISTGGSRFCTGFMVNDATGSRTPYFMTANHCGISSGNAASLVVYWNYQSPTCGQHGGGSLTQHQTGSTFRAAWSTSDFTLVQLSAQPNPTWNVTYAGWDRRDVNATSIVAIHHPNTDQKSISFSDTNTFVASYLGDSSPGDSSHLRVQWELVPKNRGVTEPGSSGSPLFDQNHHILGQLHGGYSACGASDMRDWYGRFFKSWTGGGSNSNRLSNWLDPNNTGVQFVDTLVPSATGIRVTPASGLDSSGDPGGPFTPASFDFTVKDIGTTTLNYQVSATQSWVSLTNATGTLNGGQQATITVSISADANALPAGNYTDTLTFTNLTDHAGDTTRPVTLHVGGARKIYEWTMDTNPGWTADAGWAYGTPTGAAGDHGLPDPNSAHTGPAVYGYNLTGGYTNSLTERNLTTTAIDCTGITQVQLRFWRWLGVESSTYDHAYVRVSNNGTTWTNVWSNSTTIIDDGAWTQVVYDISALTDNQPTVYIRWTMGTTDSSWTYCGWNIDDVELWGLPPCTSPHLTTEPQGEATTVGESVTFTVAASGTATLGYQWRKDTNNIDGATDSSYTISSATLDDTASYDCVVTNGCGSANSDPAALKVWLRGDVNCDGAVDFGDINPFVLVLTGPSAWQAAYPGCPLTNADINQSGAVGFDDINPFVALLSGP